MDEKFTRNVKGNVEEKIKRRIIQLFFNITIIIFESYNFILYFQSSDQRAKSYRKRDRSVRTERQGLFKIEIHGGSFPSVQ